MSRRRSAFAAIVAAVLLWGFSFISIKVSLAVLPPMSLGAVRFALAVVVLGIVKRRAAAAEKLAMADLPYLAGAGLVGVTAYFFFENNGVSLVSASEASIIVAAIPVLTLAAEWLAGALRGAAPRLGKRRWIGAALSMAGVWLVAGATFAATGSVAGYLFMLGAAASWVGYCFLTRPLFARRSRVHIVFWQSVFGFLGFLPFAAIELPRWGTFTWPVAAHVAYLGVACSALGYLLYSSALETLGVAVSTVFVNLIPVVTVAASFVFLGDRLAPVQWLGAAAAIAGVSLATRERRPAAGR